MNTVCSIRAAKFLVIGAWLTINISQAMAQSVLPADITNSIRKKFGADELRYFDSSVDLNGDGKPEILAYIVGPMVCGTGGCNLLVFTPEGAGYRLVSDISLTQPPIRASSNKSLGWRNLIVRVGGGGEKSRDAELAFDGKSYPANPTVPSPRAKSALVQGSQMLINEYNSIDDGKLLATAGPSPAAVSAGAGPSFDCAKSVTPVEKLVCSDEGLAALDRKLANAYAKGLSPQSEWGESDKKASREAQRAWIAERNACTKAKDFKGCVTSAYQRRLAELQIQNGDLGTVPTPIEYRCKGLENTPVTVVFYEKTEPPAAVVTVGNRQVVAFATQSGSGAKYTTKGVEFWEHHGDATMKWTGNTYSCKAM